MRKKEGENLSQKMHSQLSFIMIEENVFLRFPLTRKKYNRKYRYFIVTYKDLRVSPATIRGKKDKEKTKEEG